MNLDSSIVKLASVPPAVNGDPGRYHALVVATDPVPQRLPLPDELVPVALRPGDAGYERVRHTYTRRGAPAAVLCVRGPGDIAATLALARRTGLPLAIRSGGHGLSGRSTNDGGLVVSLSRLRQIEVVDARSRTVRVESGALWGEVASILGPLGWAVSSGDTGDVGVGGSATTGGIGWLARLSGLTVDHVRAVELVLADGTFVRADAEHHPDLFWAMRGAGGSFGVATAFEVRADDVGSVLVAVTVLDASDPAALLVEWGAAVEAASRALTSFLTLAVVPGAAGPMAQATTVCAGDVDHSADLAPLLGGPRVLDSHVLRSPLSGLLPATGVAHHAEQPLSEWRSGLLDHLSAPAAAAIAAVLTSGRVCSVQLRSVGGAVNDVPPGAMAYAHRSQNFCVAAAGVAAERAALDVQWELVRPHVSGLYRGLDTRSGTELLEGAFPPPSLERLCALKARYDPDGLFDHSVPIPAVAAGDR